MVDGGSTAPRPSQRGDTDAGSSVVPAGDASGAEASRIPTDDDGPCTGRTGEPGDTVLTLSGGRTAALHVPKRYDPTKRTMLVFNMHGFTSDTGQEQILTGMNDKSDERGFIVVYPQGVGNSFNAGDCCGDARDKKIDDVAFVKEILTSLRRDYCIDARRTFATGMSNGGFLSHRLACEMSDTFAAIAPVAGVLGVAPESCKPARPVPVLHFHGTADPIVPYDGGKPLGLELGYDFRSVADSTTHWRKHNGCGDTPKNVYKKGDASCDAWACNGGSEVVLCTIDGGGHTWPDGFPVAIFGKTSTDVDATSMMLAFFDAHPMP